MELWIGWFETQVQDFLTVRFTPDRDDYYECWEPRTVQTSPYGYKRTNDFCTLEDAEKWCEENSTDSSHYFCWSLTAMDKKLLEKLYPVAEKWYYC